ncbi:hypothetical protein Poly59_53360 [Rubripirellula reticaptiva]|uniref:Uncharacterized protein n=1 Tax=Rubripirellula reticaptiva TaxID=2528013 RepID=A0A5C6ED49_9BACT|nr:hypothetical protein Poly59_53360 [Rubripirellula reticaptiva]
MGGIDAGWIGCEFTCSRIVPEMPHLACNDPVLLVTACSVFLASEVAVYPVALLRPSRGLVYVNAVVRRAYD